MNRYHMRLLRRELQTVGASVTEIDELLPVSQLVQQSLRRAKVRRPLFRRWLPYSLTAATAFSLGVMLVVISQAALPGTTLFPIQKLSDNVAVAVDSSGRGPLMMKRAEQVKQLVAARAATPRVLAALADYHIVAAAYHAGGGNYAVIDFCKTDLSQAANMSSGSVHQAITQTVRSLDSV